MSRLVLVTGGAGFIGSHLVDALLARGDRVRVLDDFSSGRRENLAQCRGDIELLEGDVRDPGLVARAVAGCDGVLHEAAVASVTRSLDDPVGAGSVTHGGTVNVATQARRAGAGAFVLASSCAVYGDTDALPISEDAPPHPLSPYALAKLLSEGLCRPGPSRPADGLHGPLRGRSARRSTTDGRPPAHVERSAAAGPASGDMAAVCLRYFNVYGPRQDPSSEYSGVIARFMEVAARRGTGQRDTATTAAPPYVVYGDGRQTRDFVFVSDVVRANLLALDACLDEKGAGGPGTGAAAPADEVDGAVLNVGTGVQVSVLDIVAAVEKLGGDGSGWPGEAGVGMPIDFRPARAGDIRASRADVSRARAVLGFEPVVRFEQGLAATFEWYVGRVATSGVS